MKQTTAIMTNTYAKHKDAKRIHEKNTHFRQCDKKNMIMTKNTHFRQNDNKNIKKIEKNENIKDNKQ